ncbi:low molecular weight phosphotyrosine protein phosphatase [Paraburkholderia fungorum]|jgi:protein-tyrosine phosphatase|uniref:protein-tyrosine-phosphatase n=1 Tax=Paraburkholderia fungorum TaxID=134537 RepID=A0AAP5UTW5_9BURK|nr:low molecular weight protein-tyrosine-phosphatase [Paraburkholderia fungorum]MDT8838256.1 low molecular weight phosphotyrosine protein phosphatase [Paraburkholderia fungorum]PRZ51904.1 protein tyrosine phosphatase [Paraburkholderia fungorum]
MKLLVICHANVCRSPMAESVLRRSVGHIDGFVVDSAGLSGAVGEKVHPLTAKALRERNYEVTSGTAKLLLGGNVAWADLVFVMDKEQRKQLIARFPAASGKIWLLGHWINIEVKDPVGGDYEIFKATLDTIEKAVQSWLPALRVKK